MFTKYLSKYFFILLLATISITCNGSSTRLNEQKKNDWIRLIEAIDTQNIETVNELIPKNILPHEKQIPESIQPGSPARTPLEMAQEKLRTLDPKNDAYEDGEWIVKYIKEKSTDTTKYEPHMMDVENEPASKLKPYRQPISPQKSPSPQSTTTTTAQARQTSQRTAPPSSQTRQKPAESTLVAAIKRGNLEEVKKHDSQIQSNKKELIDLSFGKSMETPLQMAQRLYEEKKKAKDSNTPNYKKVLDYISSKVSWLQRLNPFSGRSSTPSAPKRVQAQPSKSASAEGSSPTKKSSWSTGLSNWWSNDRKPKTTEATQPSK